MNFNGTKLATNREFATNLCIQMGTNINQNKDSPSEIGRVGISANLAKGEAIIWEVKDLVKA